MTIDSEAMVYGIEPILRDKDVAPRQAEREAVARLLCRLAGRELDVAHLPGGAPVVEGFHISISHCRSHAAVVLSRSNAVGIDIEECRRCRPALIARVGNSGDSRLEAWRLWCAKEAVFKAAGEDGLILPEIAVGEGEATARGKRFRLTYPPAPEGLGLCIAESVGADVR